MKRNVAFLAAVCVSAGICFATSVMGQDQTPPPPPTDASGDTVKTNAPTPQAAPATDTTGTDANAARARRMRTAAENQRTYIISLGIGSGVLLNPDEIKDNFNPSFGATFVVGARQYGVTAAVNFGYNFYLADGTTPNDLNILTMFADLRYSPLHTKARPYIALCGGLWRQWIVDLDYTENVLGYGGGGGVEVELDRVKRLFLDVRYMQGQTRETASKSNTETLPIRLGVTWEFK
jgi:hypothetical protein